MDPIRQQRRDELFRLAIALAPADWPAFLEEACRGDDYLRAAVQELLAYDAEAEGGPLDGSADASLAPVVKPGERIDRYIVDTLIGEGGMAAVFKGHDPQIEREVALKVVRPAALTDAAIKARFLSEIRALGRLRDPGIVQIYDVCEHRGNPVLVLELLAGEDLDALIAANRTGDLRNQCRIARELAAALEHVHAAGILHRDIKPANVFVETGGRIRLLDFGISGFDTARATRASMVGMTPEYASPEQVRGEPPTSRSDIYAYGVVLFELFSGTRLYRGQMASTLYRIVHEPIPEGALQSRVPEPIVALIRQLTAKDPAQRPQSFSDVRVLLDQLDEASAAAPPEQPAPAGRRQRQIVVLAVSVVVAVAIAAFSYSARNTVELPREHVTAQTHTMTVRFVDESGVRLGGTERIVVPQQTKFRMQVASPEDGFLYVFSESTDAATVNVLFPTTTSYSGSSRLSKDTTVSIPESSWFYFGDTAGVERLWMLWSRAPLPEMDAARRWANDDDRGVIKDRTERMAIQAHWSHSARVTEQDDSLNVSSTQDPIIVRVLVEHH